MPFDAAELPYGVFSVPGRIDAPRVGVAVGRNVLDLAELFGDECFRACSLNPFMSLGRQVWTATRARIKQALAAGVDAAYLVPIEDAVLHLPFQVADFVDFYSSLEHAANAGRILRPGREPVRPNWRHLPIGYHGRAGTVVVSGTPVVRPHGQFVRDDAVVFDATAALDAEAEVGFVVGTPSSMGEPVPARDFAEHVFGVVLLLDWSARDVQAYESVPLGPFLSKSFATTISAWVVPLEALASARVEAPPQQPPVADYLRVAESWALDLRLELTLNGTVLSRPRFDTMYWTAPQQLAHLTVGGASVRTGDLFASGTVSSAGEFGSLLELTWNGERPLTLADGSARGYLADGDVVRLTAHGVGADGAEIELGEADGRVASAVRR